jgi:preprotein translocase subunit SecG
MGFIIGLLTLFMVLDCVVLVFLVLIQLPKKEAGAGLAFGASASDALFGAGSGNVLTKITKYAATIFFVMAVLLSILQSKFHSRSVSGFQERLEHAGTPALPPAPASTPITPPTTQSNNVTLPQTNLLIAQPEVTNAPAPALPTTPNTPAPEPK